MQIEICSAYNSNFLPRDLLLCVVMNLLLISNISKMFLFDPVNDLILNLLKYEYLG